MRRMGCKWSRFICLLERSGEIAIRILSTIKWSIAAFLFGLYLLIMYEDIIIDYCEIDVPSE